MEEEGTRERETRGGGGRAEGVPIPPRKVQTRYWMRSSAVRSTAWVKHRTDVLSVVLEPDAARFTERPDTEATRGF